MPTRRLALLLATAAIAIAAAKQDYGRDIRPILSENCFHCHGSDPARRMANLRLDTAEGAAPAIAKILERITTENKARRMPPAASNRSLNPEQVAKLKQWIEEGAQYAEHWAFRPPTRPQTPKGQDPIAYLVAKKLEIEQTKLSPPATPATWLRRATLDLTGLPPTPEELAAFTKNPNYERAVDRLLASPRYGERMAVDWLDVARYADTHGFNNDSAREMWRWRDWVIAAFNQNKPYNQFLTEQLAGDLLPNATLDQRIATGFGRNHVINSEGGIIEEEYRVEYVADRVRTLGMAWLGLTVECARCHDHKYDPITQRDHYRFYAFFNNVSELGEDGRVANAVPLMPAPTADQQAKAKELDAEIAKLRRRVAAFERNTPVGTPLPVPAPPTDAAFTVPPANAEKETKPVPVSARHPLAFTLWLKPTAADNDVSIFSTMDYARAKASVSYGAGWELRINNGELEFRMGQRYPAYAMRVRSEGAKLQPNEWRHLAMVYSGDARDKEAMRAPASWVRMFIDGREVATQIIHDGATVPGKTAKPSQLKFRIGWNTMPGSAALTGELQNAAIWIRELTPAEIKTLFAAKALTQPATNERERRWQAQATQELKDAKYAEAVKALEAKQAERLALQREMPSVMVMDELADPRQTFLLKRGQYDQPGEKLEPGVPEKILGPWPQGAPKNRLGLAQWLTKPDHPLTARVVVNRFWQQLFGVGLVKTSENFGLQGEYPVHPELLDWLAREFVDSGWNVKALLRQIVLSPVYRQDSKATPELIAKDPENRLLARGPRVRLPAESIRDQALQISGLLQEQLGGPSVYPYQPADLYKGIVVAADYPGTVYKPSEGAGLHRRSLYTFWKRTVPHPTMTVFDAPDREFCIVRRSSTNTPLQALTLLNDPIFVEAARKLAERVMRETQTDSSRLSRAFTLATGRAPDDGDLKVLTDALASMRQTYTGNTKAAKDLLAIGQAKTDPSLNEAELAAFTAVTNIILNLDETITKG